MSSSKTIWMILVGRSSCRRSKLYLQFDFVLPHFGLELLETLCILEQVLLEDFVKPEFAQFLVYGLFVELLWLSTVHQGIPSKSHKFLAGILAPSN